MKKTRWLLMPVTLGVVAAACGGGTKTSAESSSIRDAAACHNECTDDDERPSVHPERNDTSDLHRPSLARHDFQHR